MWYICHSHRNWATKFNLAVRARMYGGSKSVSSTDAQVSQHDSTCMREGFSHLNEKTDNCDVIIMTSLLHCLCKFRVV